AETKLSQIQNVISPDSDSRDASASQISKEKYPGSVATRLLLWKQSLGLVKQNPLFGVGAGNWKINFPKTGLNEFDYYVRQGNKHFQRPHNDFICVLCESGITGLLFYLTAYIMIIVFAIKSFFKEKSRNHRMLSVLLCAGLIGYLVISFFDFPVERITHNILICIYFAIILRLNPGTVHKEIIISRKSKYVFLVFCLVTGIFSIHVSRQRLKGEMYSNKLLHAQATQNWKVLIKEADNASSRYYSMDPFSTPVSWYKGVALFSLSRLNEAQAEFSKAYRQHPYHLQILNNLASCYEIKGNHVRSVELYRKALEISSGFEEAIVNLSIVYFNLGEIEKAFQTIQTNRISENPKYIIAIKAILAKKTEIIAQRQSNKWLADKIIAQTEDREKLRKIFEHSIIHNTSFEEEMLCTVKESK
ncbi:MAG: O-antigen ligase family protein, partial [Bacteroidetes bacterium]|nr:O-antigen ligase family protein [Bacteroidota bacterium]